MAKNAALKIPSTPGVLRNAMLRARMIQAELGLVYDDSLSRRDPAAHVAIAEAMKVASNLEQALLKAMSPKGFLEE